MLFNFISIRSVFICLNLHAVTKEKQLTVGDAKGYVFSLGVSNSTESGHIYIHEHTYTQIKMHRHRHTDSHIHNIDHIFSKKDYQHYKIHRFLNTRYSLKCKRNGKMQGHCGCGVFKGSTDISLSQWPVFSCA